ncbi:TlpA disulfide reductase family protein [Flagellimonas sp. S3867]|uniref:TlpA family protein disulfide reductase n=1 Tax=Flagellimonas sp. S3867 TaxID=2768063 RepID=UPI0016874354|nr:TlpA disulfide reductase family protein [Flagellimonas sp. S3867]
MKFSKDQLVNAFWILAIILIVFTPVGFHARVLVGKLFATSADIVETGKQKTLASYAWKLDNLDGNHLNFESNQGEVVLVNLWATWCPPCVAELPSIEKLYKDYGNKVRFMLVTNESPEKVSEFLQKKKYDLPVYFEKSQTPGELVSRSIPATYIISKSGKIVVDEKGAANWNSESTRALLDQLLLEQ